MDENSKRFWKHFTSGSGRPVTLTESEMREIESQFGVSNLVQAECDDLGNGQINLEKTLDDPWKQALGGVNIKINYECSERCVCENNAWSMELSDQYDWDSNIRDFTLHRSLEGQVITLGFDLVQTASGCLAAGHWKRFKVEGRLEESCIYDTAVGAGDEWDDWPHVGTPRPW